MATGQIHDMDIIPHPCSVRCRIVIAKNFQFRKFANCHLGYIGNKIVWHPFWIFTDSAGRMSAHRVEVPKQGNVQGWIRQVEILQDLFDHYFAPTVWI